MHLWLLREPTLPNGATHGSLYIDGHWQCWTLEDAIRDIKIPQQTAIPAGRYRVTRTPSTRFKRVLPLLLDVPGFQGIRIHAGNTIADTEGCILVGRDRAAGVVRQSRVALAALEERLVASADPVWITVDNPRPAAQVA